MRIGYQAARINAIPDMKSHKRRGTIEVPNNVVDKTAFDKFEAVTNRQFWSVAQLSAVAVVFGLRLVGGIQWTLEYLVPPFRFFLIGEIGV